MVDVSEQKEMEVRRWESEAKFQVLAERSPNPYSDLARGTDDLRQQPMPGVLRVSRKEILSKAFIVQDCAAEESRRDR